MRLLYTIIFASIIHNNFYVYYTREILCLLCTKKNLGLLCTENFYVYIHKKTARARLGSGGEAGWLCESAGPDHDGSARKAWAWTWAQSLTEAGGGTQCRLMSSEGYLMSFGQVAGCRAPASVGRQKPRPNGVARSYVPTLAQSLVTMSSRLRSGEGARAHEVRFPATETGHPKTEWGKAGDGQVGVEGSLERRVTRCSLERRGVTSARRAQRAVRCQK